MKTLLVLTALIGLTCAQGNFFSNIFGGNNNRPPPQRRPQPQAFRPRPPQQRPPPQQQQFRPQPQNRPPPRRPVQQPQPQQAFRQPAPQETFRRPQPQPQTRPQEPQTIALSGDGFEAPVVPSSKFNCPITTPNHQYNGRGYVVTFFDKSDGCNKFQAEEAVEFCKSIGGQVVSLDSNEKALAMMDLLRQRAQRYMWTGGRIDHNAGVVTWPSGAREGYVRGQRFWSPTGGKKPTPEPQPDNRDGNEICIGVLNNFYADGIKWHDVSCHHKKPTICEL